MATDGGLMLLTTLCWVLILACCPSLTGAESRLATAYRRALLEPDSHKPQVIRAELIRRDHPGATGSTAERYAAAVEREQARIARRLGAGEEFTTPLITGIELIGQLEYVMTLYLGTPAQKFVLAVDTGSDLVWVQCQPCNSPYRCYNETDPFFNPSASSSYSAIPCSNTTICDRRQIYVPVGCDAQSNCHITYAYETPGSGIAGVLSTETISFNNSTGSQPAVANFIFGCMNNDTATFGTADGLAGFSRGPISLPSQLSKLTSLDVFSYCLIPIQVSTNLSSPLLFGASNSSGLQLVYTPILDIPDDPTPYWVNMTGISINGTAVSIPQASLEWNPTSRTGGTVFDSGTTLTLLARDIFKPVIERFQSLITYPSVPNNSSLFCFDTSGVQQPEFPSMTLHFSGVNGTIEDFPLNAENLYLPVSEDGTVQCLFISIQDVGFPSIIGNIAQANHYIETDLVNQRIGWTSKDCSLPL